MAENATAQSKQKREHFKRKLLREWPQVYYSTPTHTKTYHWKFRHHNFMFACLNFQCCGDYFAGCLATRKKKQKKILHVDAGCRILSRCSLCCLNWLVKRCSHSLICTWQPHKTVLHISRQMYTTRHTALSCICSRCTTKMYKCWKIGENSILSHARCFHLCFHRYK